MERREDDLENMNIPSAKQAQALWLKATGMNCKQISEAMGCTPAAAQQLVCQAQKKATQIGLRMVVDAPPEPPTKVGSGMTLLRQMAVEAGLLKT